MDAVRRIIERFELIPHPEGGHFREVYRSPANVTHPGVPQDQPTTRCAATFIYYLLAGNEFSAFHRVKWSDEAWHLYAGGPLELHVIDTHGLYERRLLSTALDRGEPTTVISAGHWQAARLSSEADWAFGGCTVAPGFDFADFEMPAGADLCTQYPDHSALIGTLTRA